MVYRINILLKYLIFLKKVTFLSLKLMQPLHVFYRIISRSVDIHSTLSDSYV